MVSVYHMSAVDNSHDLMHVTYEEAVQHARRAAISPCVGGKANFPLWGAEPGKDIFDTSCGAEWTIEYKESDLVH